MPNTVYIDLEIHKNNLDEAISMALKSQAKKIVFIGLDLAMVQQAFVAGREVSVLQVGSVLPESAVLVPLKHGTERSRAFILALEIVAARSKDR